MFLIGCTALLDIFVYWHTTSALLLLLFIINIALWPTPSNSKSISVKFARTVCVHALHPVSKTAQTLQSIWTMLSMKSCPSIL